MLNIGTADVTAAVTFSELGLPSTSASSYSVTLVYEGHSQDYQGTDSVQVKASAMGGVLLVVAPAGTAAAECPSATGDGA